MEKTVDDTISSLISKGYLVLLTDNEQVIFNIDNIFSKNEMIENNDIFKNIWSCLAVLSQKDALLFQNSFGILIYNILLKKLLKA